MSAPERPLKKRKKRLKPRPKQPDAPMEHPDDEDVVSQMGDGITPRNKEQEILDSGTSSNALIQNDQKVPPLIHEDTYEEKDFTENVVNEDLQENIKEPIQNAHVNSREEMVQLKTHIVALEGEREQLRNRVKAAEANAEALRASPMRNVGRASDLAANRIVELGKRIRELREDLARAEERARTAEAKAARSFGGCGDGPREGSEVLELQEKLAAANARLYETRNQVQHLKLELNKAQKALISEVGEGQASQGALSPGWRGRAQQILTLQQKVSELQEKLTSSTDRAATVAQASARLSERSKEVELARELEAVKVDLEETIRKLEFSKGRIKTLSQDCASLRSKNEALQEKNAQDQVAIAELKVQLAEAREKARDAEIGMAKKVEHQLETLKKDLSQEKTRIRELQTTLTERDAKILSLQARLYPNLQRNPKVSCSNAGSPPPSTAGSSEKGFERPQSEWLEKVSHERSPIERPMSEKPPSEKSTPRPLSRGMSASAIHQTTDKEESRQSMLATIEAERIRLMELVSVNNRRLEEERDTHDKTQQQLRLERHKCARLETKVARLELERVGWAKGVYKKPPGVNSIKASIERTSEEWDVLKDRSELLEEKCLALESRVRVLQQEKEEDSRRFLKLLEEIRTCHMEQKKKTT